jgi:hypothetical protein
MRAAALLLVALMSCPGAAARAGDADRDSRYGVALDTKAFPQATPKEALASALAAIEKKKFNYLVAHLADPTFVDDRVKRVYAGRFAEQVLDTQARLDPPTVKQLKRFLDSGKWTIDKTSAVVQLDDVKQRCVNLVKKDGRWYLEHRFAPPAK